MKQKSITIDHPLWDRLRALDEEAAWRFPVNFDPGFGTLGLILYRPPRQGRYRSTPGNSLAFAHTGGDGVHFSFLVSEGKVTESSPVVITIPVAWDRPNFIGGESLFDFLCLGYYRGYFALGELLDQPDKLFEAYQSPEWHPTEDSEWAVGFGVNDKQRPILNYLISELGLSPWKDVKRKFQRLQDKYMPLLDLPESGDRLG